MYMPLMPYFASEMVDATITHVTPGDINAEGEYVPGGMRLESIRVTEPQPVKMNEIQLSEPGQRISDFVKVRSENPLIATVGNGEKLTIREKTYVIWQSEDRRMGGFYWAILRKLP